MYNVDISVKKQIDLQEATENDEELKMLKQVIKWMVRGCERYIQTYKKLLVIERMSNSTS